MERYLDELLTAYGASDIYPFHMPGHKRQRLGNFTPEEIDVTEVEGLDDLHHAGGILREGQERLARVFGADESFYLIDGSTAGILAAVCACCGRGGRVLIGRNCHRSVYHAAYLAEAKLAFVYPDLTDSGLQGSIPPEQVEEALCRNPDVRAVVITSPTYDGVVSDIRAIADIVHARDLPLIVDEAHGAHFGFSDGFPQKAIALGADLCVESLHKTLPAYTQSAALHLKKTGAVGEAYRFDAGNVQRYLDIFQSSSPSYVLMAGLDRCVRIVGEDAALYANPETRKNSRFGQFEERLREFYDQCDALTSVRVFPAGTDKECQIPGIYARDPSKILISAERAGLNGQELYEFLLKKYRLQMEMAADSYVVALTGIMDTDEGFSRLIKALFEIDRIAADGQKEADGQTAADGQNIPDGAAGSGTFPKAGGSIDPALLYGPRETRMELAQAIDAEASAVLLDEAAGRISAEFVCLYPPGIPILIPGEVIREELIGALTLCAARGMQLYGIQDTGDTGGIKVRAIT
ncbi:MAG: aminotransferase class V-fold PLP-dependent enzyme [Lachnospiraceae bacterium]|nr:aminotransferase class V-fold PLP-dependent enzyme [Lachnospiraceae bacterium]